jgi:hypothetical protein
MRKYISIALLTITCFTVQAQSLSKVDSEAINNRFKEFLSNTAKQDFEKVLGYLHPKQFESSSNIDMKQMTQLLKLLNIKLEMDAKIGQLNGLADQNDSKYALADYILDLKLTLNEQNKAFADQIVGGLKGQFGAENINYDASKYLITAKGKKFVIWVKEKALGKVLSEATNKAK